MALAKRRGAGDGKRWIVLKINRYAREAMAMTNDYGDALIMSPATAAMVRRHGERISLPVIEDRHVPDRTRCEVVDDRDPFVDYEDDVRLAKSNGFARTEERTVIYRIRFPEIDLPSIVDLSPINFPSMAGAW